MGLCGTVQRPSEIQTKLHLVLCKLGHYINKGTHIIGKNYVEGYVLFLNRIGTGTLASLRPAYPDNIWWKTRPIKGGA